MTERRSLVLATANEGKIAELNQLLGQHFEVVGRPKDLAETIEDGETLEMNALKKAREVVGATSSLAVADDTGLFVEALDGKPGVHTARFAGPRANSEENVSKLMAELDGIEHSGRKAQFRTVIAAVWPEGRELVVEGQVTGLITSRRRGESGFGYDPVFAPIEGDGRTFAEMGPAEKNKISHRGRAIEALLERLL